jgi:hypothetical protein
LIEMAVIDDRSPMPRSTFRFQFGLKAMLLLTLGIALLLSCPHFISFDGTVRSTGSYNKLRDRIRDELVAHFPAQLPPAIQQPNFYYSPGPLQATQAMQLFVTLTPDDVNRRFAEFRARALEHYVGIDFHTYDYDGTDADGVEMRLHPWNRTLEPSIQPGAHDHIFVLYTDELGDGSEAGVMINRKDSTILYYFIDGY